ncbi:MAG: NapC/NirT family cytochrome c [Gammaproteobacteria bacterium]|nr:NapC/NirT family cytochrome c [Gammaproteobacteria bacterium]
MAFLKLEKRVLTVFVTGVAVGIILWGGFHTVVEMTNSPDFCTSCHEMAQTVFPEYKKSVHYSNASGVRATCADCHVPKEWGPKMVRKIQASNELIHKMLGTIDTKEKFEAKRAELAERVWLNMQQSDSRECRNCHDKAAMDFHKQRKRSAEKMERAFAKGKETCIDCHKGIAHKLPEGYDDDDD